MTYYGVNFRQTLAGGTSFPGDGANDVWCGQTNSSFPTVVLANGFTAGWTGTAPSGGNSANFGSPADARIGGASTITSSNTYKINAPNGTYDVRIGISLNTGTLTRTSVKLKVGAGTVNGTDQFQIDSVTAQVNNTNVLDASGNVWTRANWPANNVPLRVVVTQGFFTLSLGNTNPGALTHFSFQEVVTPLVDGVITDESHTPGNTPVLMEAQPPGKLLGYVDFSVGSPADIDYSVTLADGVTPDPYLDLNINGSVISLSYKTSVRHPGTGPTRTIYVVQTDKVPGKHANAPYVQAFVLNVVAAPTKAWNDGTRLSKLSTGAFNLRKKVMDAFTVPYLTAGGFGEWPGYTGQSFTNSAVCKTWAAVASAMATFKAAAGANKWFLIELDTDGTSDWDTGGGIVQNGNSAGEWDFKPELGGGLLFRTKPGSTVLIRGTIYPKCPRGVHIDSLTMFTDGSVSVPYCIRYDSGVTAAGAIALIKITNNKFGCMFDPANSAVTRATLTASKCPAAISLNGATEQAIITDNVFWGVGDAIMTRARLIHTARNDVAYQLGDTYAGTVPTNGDATYHPDHDQYEWHHDNSGRALGNINSGTHSDFYQQRTSTTPNFTSYKWFEENFIDKGWTAMSFTAQLTQNSDTAQVSSGWAFNIFSTVGTRGVDIAAVGAQRGYVEYNSFGIQNEFRATSTDYAQQGVINGGTAGVSIPIARNNIMAAGAPANVYQENSVYYNGSLPGIDPNTVMPGPFILDPTWTAAGGGIDRWMNQIATDPKTTTTAQFRAAMKATMSGKAGIAAGYIEDAPAGVVFTGTHIGGLLVNPGRLMCR